MEKVRDSGKNDIYSARFDCWQGSLFDGFLGYNAIYDFVFDLGTSMAREIFEFAYKGVDYRVWAWKGDYINLGAGAELGIYKRYLVDGKKTDHWVVDKSLAMSMGMILNYKKGGKDNFIIDYWPTEKQWWITGFNPKYKGVNKNDLTVTFGINFKDQGMYDAFYNKFRKDKRCKAFIPWERGVVIQF